MFVVFVITFTVTELTLSLSTLKLHWFLLWWLLLQKEIKQTQYRVMFPILYSHWVPSNHNSELFREFTFLKIFGCSSFILAVQSNAFSWWSIDSIARVHGKTELHEGGCTEWTVSFMVSEGRSGRWEQGSNIHFKSTLAWPSVLPTGPLSWGSLPGWRQSLHHTDFRGHLKS